MYFEYCNILQYFSENWKKGKPKKKSKEEREMQKTKTKISSFYPTT